MTIPSADTLEKEKDKLFLTDAATREKANARQRRWRAKPETKAKETRTRKKWRVNNKEKDKLSRKRWEKNNPEKVRAQLRRRRLKKTYGLTVAQFEAMLEAQGNKCAICESTDPGNKHGWYIDHCHDKKTVRKILCAHCNRIVHSKATPAILRRAAEYLEYHAAK